MMKDIKKETKQSLSIHEKIRDSGFVTYKSFGVESFKSSNNYKILKKIQSKLQNLKRLINSIKGRPLLWISFVDWKKIISDSSMWFVEAIIEGTIANWWTHKIFGLEFGVGMIIAHGFLIKQILNLYHRLKQNGSTKSIPTKNK